MLKTSLLEMLRTFDKEELKRFEAFLNSPYFNTRTYTINLFRIIKKYAPAFDDEKLDKEKLWPELFPGKEYNYGIMKNIIYDMTKLAERFFETESFSNDEHTRITHLLDKLNEKHLSSIFLSKYNIFDKSHFRSSKFYELYYVKFLRFNLRRYYLSGYNSRLRIKLQSNSIAKQMIFEFVVKFGSQFNNLYIEETEFNEVPEDNFVKLFAKAITDSGIEKYVKKFKPPSGDSVRDYKILLIHLKLMKAYLNPDDVNLFFDFKKTLIENDKYIAESAKRVLYACLGSALDNCTDTPAINKTRELYNIIKILIEKKVFTDESGKVNPSLYMLAIKTCAYESDDIIIEKIVKEFLPKTDRDLQPNLKLFSSAYLHYSKKEFDESLNFINRINIDAFPMKYPLKNLQVLISYEKNDYEMFLYLKDSPKHFLSNNKSVSESYRQSNMKFLNYTNELFKIRESKDTSDLGLLQKTIIKDAVVNKNWLLEKILNFKV